MTVDIDCFNYLLSFIEIKQLIILSQTTQCMNNFVKNNKIIIILF